MIGMAAMAFLGLAPLQMVHASHASEAIVNVDGDMKYEEIEKSELPQSVLDAFNENHSDHTFSKAYKGDEGTYKIKAEKMGIKYYFKYNESRDLKESGKVEDKEKKMEY